MKIRRYVAQNTQEAMLKVKMDLGNEAVILNVKKIRKKGIAGLFSKPMVEVLAAVDEYGAGERNGTAHAKIGEDRAGKMNFDEKEEKIAILENRITDIENIVHRVCRQLNLDGKLPQTAVETYASPLIKKASELLYSNLIKNDVDAAIAREIIDSATARLGTDADLNDMVIQIRNIITGMLGKPETLKPGEPGKPAVVIFIGPTGVGKTTTLAKIAANYLLNHNKSIGFITADTYRIAAVEQLKTYAEILNIPVSVVYSAAEISDAISQHADKDIVMIDTAGRNHRNREQFEELKALVETAKADEVYLVLSATTSSKNCKEILDSYGFLDNYKLIFTKADETPVHGIMLNARYFTGKSLSYITTGQCVPDDIEVANVEKIAKNLIGSIS